LRAVCEEAETYQRQGFGASLDLRPPCGLLIVDFVNGFADPAIFGGGNIAAAIETTKKLLAHARQQQWAIAHTRIVFADDDSDHNIFSLKVPGLLTLKENAPASAIVSELAPEPGELVVRKQVPSAFFGTGLAAWLTQRGVQTLVVAGASPAAAYAPALSMPCRSGFVRL
jgi:maleamate amidohydrolase